MTLWKGEMYACSQNVPNRIKQKQQRLNVSE